MSARRWLHRGALGTALLCACTMAPQAAQPQSRVDDFRCIVWSEMARRMAADRDRGLPLVAQLRRIDDTSSRPGSTGTQVAGLRELAQMIYQRDELRRASPAVLRGVTYVGCMTAS